jgi:hypothetical protein
MHQLIQRLGMLLLSKKKDHQFDQHNTRGILQKYITKNFRFYTF